MNSIRPMLVMAKQGLLGWHAPLDPAEVVPLPEPIVIGEGENEVDARVPQTPIPGPRDRKHPFPPLPPRGSLGQSILNRPRAPMHKRPAPRSTGDNSGVFAPPARMTGPGEQQPKGHRGRGTGKRQGHYNKHGVWVARNKGQKRKGWPGPPPKKTQIS